MFRKMMVLVGMIILVFIPNLGYAQTYVYAGEVSGTWSISGSPYWIFGQIEVATGTTLTVLPGVEICFMGHYSLEISGYLIAEGTETDSILFTALDISEGWRGLRFFDAPNYNLLSYCIIEYAHSTGSGGGIYCDYTNLIISHSSIRNNTAAYSGGGIYCTYSPAQITYCDIFNNVSYQYGGGGVYCFFSDGLTLLSCKIVSNSFEDGFISQDGGGGVLFSYSDIIIDSCFIANNTSTGYGGGVFGFENDNAQISHSILVNNSAMVGGGGISSYMQISDCCFSGNSSAYGGAIHASLPNIRNSIIEGSSGGGIWCNTSPVSDSAITYNCFFNNSGGNFTGNAPAFLGWIVYVNSNGDSCDICYNIFENPQYYSTTGDSAYYLAENSPCIDAGDPTSPYDPDWTIADIGAFYFDQSILPQIELSTNMLNFEQVVIGEETDLPLTIYNTGDTTLVIYDIYSSDPVAFFTDYNPVDSLIAPDDSLVITVTFAPQEIITYSEV